METMTPVSRRALWAILGALLPALAPAQLHESINVEGKYVPEVFRIDRLNTLPRRVDFRLESQPLQYDRQGVATSFAPSVLTLPATTWDASRQVDLMPGYIELGMGSWLNSTLSAGYRMVDNRSTLLGIRLQHNSTSLWEPKGPRVPHNRQYRYDESAGLYFTHVFRGAGRLDAALDYNFGRFNYYGVYPRLVHGDPYTYAPVPSQTVNDLSFNADWRSPLTPDTRLTWSAGAGVRYFGYRSFHEHSAAPRLKGSRETDLQLRGKVGMPWGDGSTAGIDATVDAIMLSGLRTDARDHALLALKPYYRFNSGLLDIRLGADIDVTVNAAPKGEDFSFLHIAPDVRIACQSGQVGVFVSATGGTRLNTLASLRQLDYYAVPLSGAMPVFTPLDAKAGVNLGPFSGFSIGVEGRYAVQQHTPAGGWYMTWLNYGNESCSGFWPQPPLTSDMMYIDNAGGIDLRGFSAGAHIAYEYGKLFSASASGSWQPQDGKKGIFNGYDRAKFTAEARVAARPVERLLVEASYSLRARRGTWAEGRPDFNAGDVTVTGDPGARLYRMHLGNVSNLGVSGTWSLTPDFAVWGSVDNILNRHVEMLPAQPAPGITFMAGLKWEF